MDPHLPTDTLPDKILRNPMEPYPQRPTVPSGKQRSLADRIQRSLAEPSAARWGPTKNDRDVQSLRKPYGLGRDPG